MKYVPHRQWVFSIPKRLRIYFMFDRKLLSKLSQCVWKVLSVYLKHAVYGEGAFRVNPTPNPKDLEDLFRYEVFKMLKAEGKINDAIIENMMQWHHSGFNVYCGEAIWPHNEQGLENLARYIIRASFSQERMTYIPADESSDGTAKVVYQIPAADDYLIDPDYPTDSWTN